MDLLHALTSIERQLTLFAFYLRDLNLVLTVGFWLLAIVTTAKFYFVCHEITVRLRTIDTRLKSYALPASLFSVFSCLLVLCLLQLYFVFNGTAYTYSFGLGITFGAMPIFILLNAYLVTTSVDINHFRITWRWNKPELHLSNPLNKTLLTLRRAKRRNKPVEIEPRELLVNIMRTELIDTLDQYFVYKPHEEKIVLTSHLFHRTSDTLLDEFKEVLAEAGYKVSEPKAYNGVPGIWFRLALSVLFLQLGCLRWTITTVTIYRPAAQAGALVT